jgi:hypothetical protein
MFLTILNWLMYLIISFIAIIIIIYLITVAVGFSLYSQLKVENEKEISNNH